MTARPHAFLGVACPCLTALLLVGCNQPPGPAPQKAAEKPKVEGELAYTTLSRTDADALGIKSKEIPTEATQEHLQLTGWVMAPQGREVTLTAPVGGHVREPRAPGAAPVAGWEVKEGRELFVLDPVLTPVEKIQLATLKRGLEAELSKAHKTLTLARVDLERVKGLVAQKLKQKQELEQAQLRVQHAEEDESAADTKLKLLGWDRVPVVAPLSGTALTVHVSPGQYVPPAAPLVTIADLKELWVRVPVPENDLPDVDRSRPVTVTLRSADAAGNGARAANPGPRLYDATPVAAVPLVDTARHTADLVYKMSPRPRTAPGKPPAEPTFFAKDQMVTVFVPLGRKRDESVVPYDAVVFDAHGGAWVYIDRTLIKEDKVHRYERRRVELGPNVKGGVVLRPAAQPGERVVVSGAALLFSREFHKTPVHPAGK
jgi:multidrug efflux pump subunit AcrA (membrane-fusion protein)